MEDTADASETWSDGAVVRKSSQLVMQNEAMSNAPDNIAILVFMSLDFNRLKRNLNTTHVDTTTTLDTVVGLGVAVVVVTRQSSLRIGITLGSWSESKEVVSGEVESHPVYANPPGEIGGKGVANSEVPQTNKVVLENDTVAITVVCREFGSSQTREGGVVSRLAPTICDKVGERLGLVTHAGPLIVLIVIHIGTE